MQQNVRDYTELCLKDQNGMYTVQVDAICMNINDLTELVIKPTLLAAGYHPESVEEAMGDMDAVEECPNKKHLDDILDALGICDPACAVEAIDAMKENIATLHAMRIEQCKMMRSMEHDLGIYRSVFPKTR